jgi:hypothetical protein
VQVGSFRLSTWKLLDFIYKERIEKPERSEVGQEFEWLFNEAIKYQNVRTVKPKRKYLTLTLQEIFPLIYR